MVRTHEKPIFILLLYIVTTFPNSLHAQGNPVPFNSIPKAGTILIYSHQDDDLIWMLPFWNITEKFIQGALPTSPMFINTLIGQQALLDQGYNIDYLSNWFTPWGLISDEEYRGYYWGGNIPAYSYLANDHLVARLHDDATPLPAIEINKIKAKIEQFIASPDASRIITHANWGEYGHEHHKGLNKAVRELAVKYRKDVWMLGMEGDFQNEWVIPEGANITYTYGNYDPVLYTGIRNQYIINDCWTWDYGFVPSGDMKYINIVQSGVDKSDLLLGSGVTTSGPSQGLPGSYIFDGVDDYLTLDGNVNTSFTIAMRVQPDVIRAMDISKMTEYPASAVFDRSFYLQSDGHVTARINDGQSRTVTSSTGLSSGAWTHILMTGDGSSLKIYINGLLEGTVPAGPANTPYDSPEFVLGQAQETLSFFKGQISDVRLFDYVLSDSEIATLGGASVTYTITATAGTGGVINPSGAVIVAQGANRTFTITPNSGYQIADVIVDGGSVGSVSTYTFNTVVGNHTIAAVFSPFTPTNLTISGVLANNRVYNGTTAATLNTGSAALVGVLPGDIVNLVSTGATGAFSNKNAGTGKTVTTAGFTLSGADGGNYTLTQPTATANITTAGLTVTGVTASNKVYNGTTAATLNTGSAALVGAFGGDVVNLVSTGATGAFSNKNAGTGKTVTTAGFILSGADGGNYTLTQPTATADITAAGLTVTGVTASNKVYNGTTAATLNTGSAALVGAFGGDVVNLVSTGATGAFSNKNAGTGKTVTTAGFTLSGADGDNYTLTQPTATANITTAGLTVTGVTASNKVYNGTTAATLNTGSAALVGAFGGDVVNLVSTGATGAFSNKNAGTGKPVTTAGFTLSGADGGNYTLTQPTATANITAAGLTVTGVTASNKVYNGTTAATLNTGSAALVGAFGGDVVNLVSTGATGAFSNKNAGTGKTVTTAGFTLSGADGGNYTLTQPTATADITTAGLTVTGVTANNKVYNGTTAATLNTGSAALVGAFGGDVVNLVSTGATGAFSNKNAGTGKTVTTAGFTLSGADGGNYTLTQPTATANITTAGLTVTGVTASNKVYNGTTAATLNTGSAALVGAFGGDVVNLVSTGATGAFSNKNAGTGKTVTTAGFTLSGADGGNYTLTQPTATANITTAGLTVTGVTASNKVYNGTTAATLNTGSAALVGAFGGDVVNLVSTGATGAFSNKNAGTGKTVTTAGFTLSGADGGNYTLTQPTATADITTAGLTVTGVTASNKVYNGTTAATLNTGSAALVGAFGGDIVNLVSTGATGAFSNKNAGTGKTVTTAGFTLSGADGGNYTLTQPTATADITTAGLTVTGVTASNKVYNGTTAATLNTGSAALVGAFGGDVVNLVSTGATGAFSNKNAGTGKTVTTAGFTLSGADGGNYTLTQPTATADITTAGLTVTGVTASNKVYNGTTAATLNTGSAALVGAFGGDVVNLVSTGATGAFSNKNAGTGKTVTTAGFTLSGADGGNYTLTQPTATANITTAGLTVTGVTASNKVYNGTTAATLNTGSAALVGAFGGDVVNLVSTGATGAFSNKNAGTGKTVTTAGFTLSGADGGNYTLTQPTATADITTAGLTVTGVTASNKVYNGTTAATLNTGSAALVGAFGGDVVNLVSTGATGAFSNKNAGTGKTVTTAGFTLSGADGGNYTLTQPTATADITTAGLTVTGVTANNKVYNGTTAATLNTGSAALVGAFGGDVVNLVSTGATGAFSNKNAGTGKTVTTAGFTLSGADGGNYTLTQPTATADITTAGLTVTGVTANNKVYNGTTAATLNTGSAALVGAFGGDVVNLVSTGATGAFSNKNAGTGKTVTTAGFTLSGADGGNYTLTQPTATADITTAGLTVTGVTANNKVYNGTTAATLNTGSAALVGAFGGDVVNLVSTGATGAFSNKNAGTGKTVTTAGFTLSGADGGNYTLTQPTATADITTAGLTVTGVTASNKVYNGTTAATLNTGSAALVGAFGGDVVNLVSTGATGAFSNKNAGTGKTVTTAGFTLSGADGGNYTLTQPTATADITTAGLTVTGVTASNKVYNGTTAATLNTGSAALVGAFGGDVVNLVSTGATGAFSNKNAGTGKTVTTAGFTLSGADGGNYTLTQPTATANITTAGLTVTGVTASNKVYNGTTAATLNTGSAALVGAFGGDVVNLVSTGATGAFSNKNAGTGKTVTTAGFTLSGADGGNYTLTQPTATADITAAGLTVTGVTASNKVYNGTTAATLNTGSATLVGAFGGDVVNLVSTGATGAFSNKNAGTGKPVTTAGFTLSGADGGNYTLTQPTATANITTAGLTVTGVTANNKVYNGTTAATLNTGSAALVGAFGGDVVNLVSTGATGAFSNKNAGTGKTVTTAGFTLSGADGGNYTLTQPTATADITTAGLTVTGVTANNKVYNGTTAATLNTGSAALIGAFGGDVVNLVSTGATGAFVNQNVGTGKTVNISGLSIDGPDAGNYTFNSTTTTTANITARPVTVTADAKSKGYGDSDPALTYQLTFGTMVGADSFTGTLTRAAGENIGIRAITKGTLALSSNYNLTYAGANLTINTKPVTITADVKSKAVGESDPALTFVSVPAAGSSLSNGDVISFNGALSRTAGETAGTYAILQNTLTNNNYNITYIGANLTIIVTTSVKPVFQSESELKVYPNPFTDHLYFDLQWDNDVEARIEIFNLSGSKIATIFSDDIESGQFYRLEYTPEKASTGMLFYRLVINGKEVYTGKLIHK